MDLIVVVQLLSWVWLFVIPWIATHQAPLTFTISRSLRKLISIELVMLSNHFILCCLFLLLPSIFPSIRVFSSELPLPIRWPKYWSFSFHISPSNGCCCSIDWFDLFTVQGTLKCLLQRQNSEATILGTQPSLWSNSHTRTWLLEKSP